jgi:cyclohexanone monooxygenase
MLSGPNTGIGHTSLVVMIEAQLRYVLDALRVLERRRATSVDLRPEVLRAWSREIQGKAARTVWNTGGCSSWYLDEHGRNTVLWPRTTFKFRELLARFDVSAYTVSAATDSDSGFEARSARTSTTGRTA